MGGVPEALITNDARAYGSAILLGAAAGWLDVRIADLLFTALIVMAATMLLGAWRPRRPWRWVLVIAACVPVAHIVAYAAWSTRPDRAQVYESFLGFLTGTVGAYAGAVLRTAIAAIFGANQGAK